MTCSCARRHYKEESNLNRIPVIFSSILAASMMLMDGQVNMAANKPLEPFTLEITSKDEGLGLRAAWPVFPFKVLFARNSKGVTVKANEEPVLTGMGYVKRDIWYPDGITRNVIDLSVKSVRTMLDESMTGYLRKSTIPPKELKDCVRDGEKMIGETTIAGIKMYKFSGSNKFETHERTVWLEGGCIDVAGTYLWYDAQGKDLTRVSTTSVSLKIGEPVASLFEVPDDYTEETETEGLTKLYVLKGKAPQGFYDNKLKGVEYKRYLKYGTYPGGAAEAIVRQHGWKATVPNPEVLMFKK